MLCNRVVCLSSVNCLPTWARVISAIRQDLVVALAGTATMFRGRTVAGPGVQPGACATSGKAGNLRYPFAPLTVDGARHAGIAVLVLRGFQDIVFGRDLSGL